MAFLRQAWQRLLGLLRRRQLDRDLDDELAFHLAMREDEGRAAGLSAAQARAAARKGFGNVLALKEACWDLWTFRLAEQLAQDVCFSLRWLRKEAGFTAVAVVTLALGIGATSAIFGLLDTGLLRSLPVPHPEELYLLHWLGEPGPRTASGYVRGCEGENCTVPYPFYASASERARSFAGIAAFSSTKRVQAGFRGETSFARAQFVSGNFFSVLGLEATMGRMFAPYDDTGGGAPVAIIGHEYWRTRFASDPTIIGRPMAVNGSQLVIVGVGPRQFYGLDPTNTPELWIPLHVAARSIDPEARLLSEESGLLGTIGRLKPGVDERTARLELQSLQRQVLAESAQPAFKLDHPTGVTLTSAGHGLNALRVGYTGALRLLQGLAGIVLLVACANVANLLLARGLARRREIAVRLAVGAGRTRLLTQLLVEGFVLSALGAAVGLLLGFWGSRGMALILEPDMEAQALAWIRPSLPVFGLTAAIASLTTIVFGLVPAWASRRVEPATELQSGVAAGKGTRFVGHGVSRAARWIVAGEVGGAVVLLISGGLLVRTLVNLVTIAPGFRTDHLLSVGVSPVLSGRGIPDVSEFAETLRTRLGGLPGVRSTTWCDAPLLGGQMTSNGLMLGEGNQMRIEMVEVLSVGPRFFETVEIPLLAGRQIELADCQKGARSVWVNRALAERYFAGQNPVGAPIHLSGTMRDGEIAGVVGDARHFLLKREVGPTAYVPTRSGARQFLLRTSAQPLRIAKDVERLVREVSPNLLPHDVKDERRYVDWNISQEQLLAKTALASALLALVLAAIGIYGVVSYSVSRRSREIAIRMSLGAVGTDIVQLVAGESARVALCGIALGVLGGWWASHLLGAFLFGVGRFDPLTYVGALLVLLGVVAVASYIPAAHAARSEPMAALRSE